MKNFNLVANPERERKYDFEINGVIYANSGMNFGSEDNQPLNCWTKDAAVTAALIDCTFDELNRPEFLTFDTFAEWRGFDFKFFASADYDKQKDGERKATNIANGNLKASVYTEPDLVGWNRPYSFLRYAETLESTHNETPIPGCEFVFYTNEDETKACFETHIDGKHSEPLKEWLNPLWEQIKDIHERAIERLKDQVIDGQVVARFEFPESIQTACGQYLLYFSQFLRDLGIRADSQITEDAGKVLFSVTPNDGFEALDRVREALDLYLTLPASPIVKSDDNFAIQRLEYQIDALKFQIKAHQAARRMMQREIEHQDLLLEEKNEVIRAHQLSENIMNESRIVPPADSSESEKKMFGLTKIKKAEDWGIHIDLGEVFQRLTKKTDES